MREYSKKVMKNLEKDKVRKLRRCRECNTPWLLTKVFRWDDGGALALRYLDRNLRFIFLENDLLSEVMDVLAAHFGEDEVYEWARNIERASASGYAAMVFGSYKWYLKPFTYISRYSLIGDYVMEMSMTMLGYGAGKTVDRTVSTPALYTRNPYNTNLFQADVEGVYLVAREREVTALIDPISREENIYMYYSEEAADRVTDIFKKYGLILPPIVPVKEPYRFSRCPKCGVPKQISRLLWDPRDGVIINKDTGRRVILWPCYALEKLLGTLREQLGEEAEVLITNTVKRYQRDNILNDGVGFTPEEKLEFIETDKRGQYAYLLRYLACMGYGHGVVDLEDIGRVRITMTNPLIPLVSSGLVAGMAEALEDRAVRVSWEEGAETTTYTLVW